MIQEQKMSWMGACLAYVSRFLVVAVFFLGESFAQEPTPSIETRWIVSGVQQGLKTWGLKDLQKLKKVSSTEKDPKTGKLVRWDGVLLSSFVDQVVADLPMESRAQIDLIGIRNSAGETVLISRGLIKKYPLMIAFHERSHERSKDSQSWGALSIVPPWTSRPKIFAESVPLEHYFIGNVSQIDFTSNEYQYKDLYLKRRTDPSAMRGEKIYVQSCVGCHDPNHQTNSLLGVELSKAQRFVEKGHPEMQVSIQLSERDRRSIVRYLDAHRAEKPGVRAAQVVQSNSPSKNSF